MSLYLMQRMPRSHSVHKAVAELPHCPDPFPPSAPELGRLRCVAAEEPLSPVPVTQRELERDMGKHRAVYLSSGALKRSYIPDQLVKEGQLLGILSFKGRTQCKP